MTDQTPGDAPAASSDEPIDLDALAEVSIGGSEETPTTTEAPAAEPTEEVTAAPSDTTDGPDPETESTYIFQPFDLELEGEKRRIESKDEVTKAFQVMREHGQFTRRAAAEREDHRSQMRERDEELTLLRKYREEDEALLGKLKGNKELLEYVNQEGEMKIDPDMLSLRQENAEIRQRLDRGDHDRMRTRNIQVLDATRVQHFGYTEPVSPREIQMVEQYAEDNGISRALLYSNPAILAGQYALLVGMGSIPPPGIPDMVTKPDAAADVAAQAKGAIGLPPATSGAPPTARPYSTKGKTGDQVLADMKAAGLDFGGEEIPNEVLETMGI